MSRCSVPSAFRVPRRVSHVTHRSRGLTVAVAQETRSSAPGFTISTLLAHAMFAMDPASLTIAGNFQRPWRNPMPTRYGRQAIIALSAATLLVACKPKENAATDTSTAAGAVATGSDSANRARMDTSATAANANANKDWKDGQI